jgi:2-aminoethylphosphonate-pyruvate transaminase
VVIHCETSSGILNPIDKISQVVDKEGRSLLIDSMSAFGAIPIDAGKIKFDAIVSSANKCIEGVPGFGFVLSKKSILESSEGQSHSLSLDLYSQWKYMESSGQWRFTPPTHSVLAFLSALNQHKLEGGVLGRLARYEKNKDILISGMHNLGFETLLSKKWLSPIIVAFLCPADQNFIFEKFYNLMKDEGFIIYPGKLTIVDTFRIGCIGQVNENTMKEVVSAVERSLKKMNVGSAVPSQLIIEEKERLDKLMF